MRVANVAQRAESKLDEERLSPFRFIEGKVVLVFGKRAFTERFGMALISEASVKFESSELALKQKSRVLESELGKLEIID